MICDYGCGQKGEYYFKRVKKWCCSESHNSCPVLKNKFREAHIGKETWNKNKKNCFSQETIEKMRKSRINKKLSEETKKKIGLSNRKSNTKPLEYWKTTYPIFSIEEEMRYNPDKLGEKEIQVHCKNHNCPNSKEKGGWFTPNKDQIQNRKNNLEKENGNDGHYFYCSNACKQECPLYRFRGNDSLINIKNNYTQSEYQVFRQHVLKRDGYLCQYCNEPATDVHHERPQKSEPFFNLDPDFGWSCCEKCHYEKGHQTGTPCSTGNLSNRIC